MKILNLALNDVENGSIYKYIAEDSDDIEIALIHTDNIEESSGSYLITGEVTLADGSRYPAIFGINSDDGGEMSEFYFLVDSDGWVSSSDNLEELLRKKKEEVFPFRYHLNIKVEGDLHTENQY
ncbi:MAG TPA: hypothetical protein PL155_04635 [Candidatus Omnitrophota bacterium]|nr:hypothetical protein [Candidatus Omnitrophota bacterium]HPD84236.1 hypothetical protein [Candidatus Omnitrophota bacterium]HRZ03092.1 hypothetical protein [Candidatus Omnitrophota bacterium]